MPKLRCGAVRTSRWIRLLALLLGLSLLAAACGGDDDDTTTADTSSDGGATGSADGGDSSGDAANFKACQVTDAGGIDDRSFNQNAYDGLVRAEEELGIEIAFLESQGEEDYETNINTFLGQDCDLIVTVGFLLGDATAAAAEANPDQQFAIVDFDFFDADSGEDVTFDNVRELTFATDQAAFLAGYASAAVSETGKLGTFGGINIPTVTIFMDGFLAGANHHNTEKGTAVEVLGWDGSDGLFTGDFENQDNGRNTAQSLLDEGADVVLPVAGPVGLGAAAAVRDAGTGKLVWVDTDGCESAADFCPLFLTSIMKRMDVAVFDTIEGAVNGAFEGGLYTGTLENEGVDIAPFHENESLVPAELQSELDGLRQQIIDGELEVTP
jgi:basic membrane protein A